MNVPPPPITGPGDYLYDVEEFLEMYGRGLEWRTRFNALAFLAQQISLDPEKYQEFGDVLRQAAQDPQCRLDITFNRHSGALSYVGIKPTFAPEGWGKRGKGASADRLIAEEAQANYYLTQFEIAQLKGQVERLREETGEARADARRERDRANTAEENAAQLRRELSRLSHVKATDADVKRLQGELGSLQRRYAQLETVHAELSRRLTHVGDAYQQYREGRDHHVCEVGGLRLLKAMTCGCLILADHRQCFGILHLRIEKDTKLQEYVKVVRNAGLTEAERMEFLEQVSREMAEQLHLSLGPDPNIERMRPGRLALRGFEGGSRKLRRSLLQLSTDPRPEQQRLSTYVVRPTGEL